MTTPRGAYRALVLEHVGATAPAEHPLLDALRYMAERLRGPVTAELPRLTPELWRAMRCRCAPAARDAGDDTSRLATVPESDRALSDYRACHCDLCRWQARHAGTVEEWRRSEGLRPHRIYAHPYGSLGAAIEDYQRPRGGRSSTGSALDRMAHISALGTSVQTTQRADREPSTIRRVDLSIDVGRCLRIAASDPNVRADWCDTGGAMALLLVAVSPEDAAEAWGCSLKAAQGVVRRGRRRLTVELAARELIPEPRQRARLAGEIEARRGEMGR